MGLSYQGQPFSRIVPIPHYPVVEKRKGEGSVENGKESPGCIGGDGGTIPMSLSHYS